MEDRGYSVVRALGQGTCQSRVYEVHDREGRLRVLKQLPWTGEADRAQAMREVHLLSSLRHPCIVPYLESFLIRSTPSMPSEDILCLVMKRCERDLRQECLRLRLEWELERDRDGGQELRRRAALPTEPRFKEQQVVSWLAQLCWGLHHLHSRKFLHRDLKPQNVLLSHGGRRAMLADFGVAGQVESTEGQRQSIVGTPAFMSPEMLEGRPYGLKTDQWALGCVLFEMMALEPPFASRGESYASVVSAVLHASNTRAPPGYSPELNKAVEALLARKPHARPSNRELLCSSLLSSTFRAFVHSVGQAAALAGVGSLPAASPMLSARVHDTGGPEATMSSAPFASSSGGARLVAGLIRVGAESSSNSNSLSPVNTRSGSLRTSSRSAIGIAGSVRATSAGDNSANSSSGPPVVPLPDDETPRVASLASTRGLLLEAETAETEEAYASDFESLSGESPANRNSGASSSRCLPSDQPAVPASSYSYSGPPVPSALRQRQPAGLGAAAARVLRVGGGLDVLADVDDVEDVEDVAGVENRWQAAEYPPALLSPTSISVRDDLDSSSSGVASGFLPGLSPQAAGDSLGDVGLGTDGWLQLLAEAEALLQQPPLDEGAREEAAKTRAALALALGAPEQVDRALGFLRDRRPLGETAEADELLLQVEMLELLGDEGLKQLPLLERLLAIEGGSPGCDGNGTLGTLYSARGDGGEEQSGPRS